MQFYFNERKAGQAAAYLLRRRGGTKEYMALLKLLYLADRESLIRRNRPITGDLFCAMDLGPILSRSYDLMKAAEPGTSPWYDYVRRTARYRVSAASSEEIDELARPEIRILDEIDTEFGAMDQWDLSRYTHTLPEWIDPDGSSVPIDPSTILLQAGKTPEKVLAIADVAEEVLFLRTAGRSR